MREICVGGKIVSVNTDEGRFLCAPWINAWLELNEGSAEPLCVPVGWSLVVDRFYLVIGGISEL